MSEFTDLLQKVSSINKALDMLEQIVTLDYLPMIEDFYALKNELEQEKFNVINKIEISKK